MTEYEKILLTQITLLWSFMQASAGPNTKALIDIRIKKLNEDLEHQARLDSLTEE